MKKSFFFAVLAVALAGFGMQAGTVHAQVTATATPVSNAALEQELQVAKATLVNLEMQQGMIPRGDDQITTGTGTTAQPVAVAQSASSGLTPAEVNYFTGLLSQLTGSLSQLETIIAANPSMNATQVASISTALGGMKTTLLSMATQIAQDENGSSIAMTSPSAGVVAGASTAAPAQVAQAAPATTPATTSAPVATTQTTSANTVKSTAWISSIWSFTKTNWPVIVIIVLVIAILAILFWPENKEKPSAVKTASSAPSTPKVATTAASGTGTNITAANATGASVNTNTKQTV